MSETPKNRKNRRALRRSKKPRRVLMSLAPTVVRARVRKKERARDALRKNKRRQSKLSRRANR